MGLESLQRDLVEALAPVGTVTPALGALLRGAGPRGDPAPGVAVYRRNGAGARVNALLQVYPVCAAVLGEDCLRGLAARWVSRFPSRTADLERDSARFPPWLAATTRGARAYRELPYLGDLARLEWLWQRAALAPPAPAFDHAAFAALPPDRAARARLHPHPGLGLLTTPWPVRVIHREHRAGRAPARVEPLAGPEHLVVWPAGDSPRVRAVGPGLGAAVAACLQGRTLATIAAHCAAAGGDPGQALADLVGRGWVREFRAPPS